MRIILLLAVTLGLVLSQRSQAQQMRFSRDPSRPYAYLQFDHVGKRKPTRSGESTRGLWLKFVNNSNVPMELGSFDPGTNDPGTGLLDEVLAYSGSGLSSRSANPPKGYSAEAHSSITIQPGDTVLFGVPREHVSKQWYLRVRFTLVVGKESVQQPYSYVEFTDGMLP